MSKFNEDLKEWLQYERFIMNVSNKYFWLSFKKNPDDMWVDLIWPWYDLEVKKDKQFRKTWNFYIEYSYKGERSWILKYPAEYFAIWDIDNFWVFNRIELWNWSTVFGRKTIWWDNDLTKWFLIEWRDVIPLAIYKYERKENRTSNS